ncbi:hypothetical protein [Ancylobacter defluvii]|uniref:Uncharacterized protein n=1 Tax=Ancylobacter defluvii TaxID=1282440 RepID=A0A9W6NDG3_9HYPH|nr:hypothetical protein [Ancylobacter defluvii]MBS7588298.1 hypothetical protein [Ancylobacter defluvii]GLK86695.1 hypothetical protein GCM10017653_47650 [Ancylobacter defluvii]
MRRSILLATTAIALVLVPLRPAKADPIVTPFVLSLGAGFGTAATGLTALGTLVSTGLQVGIAYGASYLASALAGEPKIKPVDITQIVKQDVPARRKHYGRRKVAGAMLMGETLGDALHMVIAHNQGEIDGFERFFLHDREVTFNELGGIVTEPYPVGSIVLDTRKGTDDQTAFGGLVSDAPSLWTNDHRGRGIAMSYLKCNAVEQEKQSDVYPQGIPALSNIGRYSLCYDPRVDARVWTRNLALQTADFLTHAAGRQIPWSYINIPRLIASANRCDNPFPKKDGSTIQQYAGGLSYELPGEPGPVLARFLFAMDGRLSLLSDCTIAIDAGAAVTPTYTLTDDHIIAYELKPVPALGDEANVVVVKYSNAAADYAEATCDPWRDEDDISASGQQKDHPPIEAYEIEDHAHARYLARLAWLRKNAPYPGWIKADMDGLNAFDERFIRVKGTLYDLDRTFEITAAPEFDFSTNTVTLQVSAFDPEEAYNGWVPALHEGTAPTIPTKAAPNTLDPPENLVVTPRSRTLSTGSLAPILELTWDTTSRFGIDAKAQISEHGADSWTDITVVKASGAVPTKAVSEVLNDGQAYDLRVRWVTTAGKFSDWAIYENAVAVADSTPTDEPVDIAAEDIGGGQVRVSGVAPNSPNVKQIKIYTNTTGATPSGLPRKTINVINPGDAFSTVVGSLDEGGWYFWAAAANGSDLVSGLVPAADNPVTVGT